MGTYTWLGGTPSFENDANTASNWSPSGTPGVGDDIIIDGSATYDCHFDIGSINDITLNANITYAFVIYASAITVTGVLDLDGKFSIHSSIPSSTMTFTGSDETLVKFGEFSEYVNGDSDKAKITFKFDGSAAHATFDNGEYPNVLVSQTMSPHVPSTQNTYATEIDIYNLTFDSGGSIVETNATTHTSNPRKERNMTFRLRSLGTWSENSFHGGKALWIFYATQTGFELPFTGSSLSSGQTYQGKLSRVQIATSTLGYKVKIPAGLHFLEQLIVDIGAIVVCDSGIAQLYMVNRPKIEGSWQFFQISDGIFQSARSDMLIPMSHGGTNNIEVVDTAIPYVDGTNKKFEYSNNFIYDDANELLEVGKIKSHIIIEVQNDTGSAISKGQAVYVSGEGTHPSVSPAQADSSSTMASIGLAVEQIAASGSGYACVNGIITANSSIIDDSLSDPADVGKTLYVSPTTAGNLTITKPTSATHLIQNVGHIADISGSNVKIIVSNIGRTNDVPNTINAVDGNFTGDVDITGKLTVGGLIDPTGLVLTEQPSDPASTGAGEGTIWVKNTTPNTLYFTDDAGTDHQLGVGGGGGSGTVTSVDMSVPTGFTISGNPITSSGTLGLAFDTGYALPTSAKQTQWDTAYGWGDHAGAGYLTSFTESDPIFTASAASGILAGDITNWNTAYGWGDHSTQGYLTSAPPETDPIFSASAAASITNAGSGDISQGDTAFGWGDHSAAGYASATPEVCVVNLATSVSNFTPTGAYTLLQQTGNWASTNPNFNTLTGLYTVPSAGVYRISWSNSFRFTPVGQLQASRIYVNGNPAAQGTTSSSGAWPIGSASVLLTLSAADTVGLYVYISTTGTTLVGDNLVPYSNHMSINKVSN